METRRYTKLGLSCALMVVCMSIATSCQKDEQQTFVYRDLQPERSQVRELTHLYAEQPPRDKPRDMVLSIDGSRLLVARQGSVDEPGHEVVAVDTDSMSVVRDSYRVGSSPTGLAAHPEGRFVVVTNRFSNYLSVIDLVRRSVHRVPADFYMVKAAFSPDGERLYLTNRWHDSLHVWQTKRSSEGLEFEALTDESSGIPVGTNPSQIWVDPSGDRVLVAAQGELTISVIDTETLTEVDVDADPTTTSSGAPEGVSRIDVGAPPNDLAAYGDHLFVATLSASTHHSASRGPDTDGDGQPGDGTANWGFQDLQNEIAVYSRHSLQPVRRYTSDTICCFDFRDVHPDDPEHGEWLADQSQWIVGGALPERLAVTTIDEEPVLLVVYSGSNEIQRFTFGSDGRLMPGPKLRTGFHPSDLVVDEQRGRAYVSNRLGETLTVVDLETFKLSEPVVVGDISGGVFPATDAELGEFYYFSGAEFSLDGDQTCNHCHRDRGNIGKHFNMPLLEDRRGTRMTPASRGLLETRPWFFEGAMDENNFFPVVNEFARAENFCCHDYPDRPDCPSNPPTSCEERGEPHSFPTRDAFFVDTAWDVLRRKRSFGDAIDTRIDYLGTTRLLGLFLIQEPALLPNPNPSDTEAVERGRRLFNSASTACATCHPAPGYATSFDFNPYGAPLHFGPVVTPRRAEDGTNLDLANTGFLDTFPMASQDANDIHLNPPMLTGLWDRAGPFLHDGRAKNLREVLCTPGHPALRPGERGYNVSDGVVDSHGGTSDLTPGEIEDMIAFLNSL